MQTLSPPATAPMARFGLNWNLSQVYQRLKTRPFFIRLRHWEYWPFAVVYAPVALYYLWLSLKARSFFFFSASNPSIETGGMLGESKRAILDLISDEWKPKTLFVAASTDTNTIRKQLAMNNMTYPLIAKPDAGERGWRVQRIDRWEELIQYAHSAPIDFLLQEYVDEPLELGVFYYRLPGPRSVGQAQGVVSSVVQKEFLTIRGNGRNCVEELIGQNERAILQLPVLKQQYGHLFHQVLAPGETMTLVGIGNHCKGTKFLNANHLITPELTRIFDQISDTIDGFYFGRYDLRCRSVTDLYAGRHIRIMELNGAGAEPAHIYQPGFSLREAYRVLFHHWGVLYDISRDNHRRGVPYMTLQEARQVWKRNQSTKKAAA
ncbi:hypothetical protein [Fibrella aquatilis]|uniref:ATP-grasp domain-containing protein n=1 Tax=Fibrella aquatilis TaxID=2817059 RepID=A0A939JWW3_9BACT|nr:hypothetical protein [Fibrella aquatilis]MBO0932332.1 hypothetical protein [Fibrella aquatilis]